MEFLLDALLDSLKLLPFLLIAYILIEVIEYFSASKLEHSKLLTSKWSTLFASTFGLVPQCGFSVVATDLYASKKLKLGTLFAVYIATSDEAVPLLLMSPEKINSLLPLLIIKFIAALIFGYLIDFIFSKQNKKLSSALNNHTESKNEEPAISNSKNTNATDNTITETHEHQHAEEEHNHNESNHTGCCGHEINLNTKKAKLKKFFIHPLIHTLKIFAFILIVNIIFSGLVEWVGKDSLTHFLSSSYYFAPLIASLIGLIPNCASSVVITELYTLGGISFGACVAGLIVNAGIGFVILFKQNKNIKQNFAILGGMLAIGISVGYIIQFIGF